MYYQLCLGQLGTGRGEREGEPFSSEKSILMLCLDMSNPFPDHFVTSCFLRDLSVAHALYVVLHLHQEHQTFAPASSIA